MLKKIFAFLRRNFTKIVLLLMIDNDLQTEIFISLLFKCIRMKLRKLLFSFVF